MSTFLDTIKHNVIIGDGAIGSMLVKHGLGPGENPELWMLSHPEELKSIHRSYLNAGARVIQTNTFGANRLKLSEYNSSSRVREINITAARYVREVVEDKAFVAGIIGPTGHFPSPLGDIDWTDLVDVFKEQSIALEEGGVDFIFLETFSDLGEIRAALFAAKNYTSLPVACSLTYTNGRTLTGTTPTIAAAVLSSLGADIIGANCSTGPKELLDVMKEYRAATTLPLLVEPNAGMPELINGETVYNEHPETFASFVEPFRQAGVNLIGSCCGSTPEHTRAMVKALSSSGPITTSIPNSTPTLLASRSKIVALGSHTLPLIIGERINPTARKAIAQAFRDNNWDMITQEGFAQVEAGAELLDLNVGVPGLDEGVLLKHGVRQLQMALDIPLVLDCTQKEALEKGLQEYQGRALINSVNGEERSLRSILPLAKKYGAAVLGLCLDDRGIPEKAEERLEIAKTIVQRALEYGLKKEDIVIDCLVLTAAASPKLSMETVRAISLVKKELGVATALGLSNVSHGLPQRTWLNSAFLALTLGAGLDAAIANPSDNRIKETINATALLTGRDEGATNYLIKAGKPSLLMPVTSNNTDKGVSLEALESLIFHGQQEPLIPLIQELLSKHDMLTIINKGILPSLEKIGDLFASGEVFLPQLIMSGDSAKLAFAYLKENFPDNSLEEKGTIVIGTVRGDIHDIGKNITAAVLENHGYKVIDLGKNVSGEEFLAAAIRENAHVVGLSALMTTTMVEMGPIVEMIKNQNSYIKVIIGGAVVTADFARQINADGYGKDAVEAVKLVESLLSKP
ncbi:MAG: 5-methyltetrahydrofolate--homocysteine methyltransferase [Firmicutes bacterium HGW-Firmicutes-12]|nr:MAG: 5-methyltetrahydrofolate--homocysteine methyltransferase [Firmicutes bacterium HGW-Firmicutes-12]